MTATTYPRTTSGTASPIPTHGTFGIAANTLCLLGTIACVDSDGNTTPGALNAGLDAVGCYQSTVDNRTAATGGAAAAVEVDVEYGEKEVLYSGTAPKPGQVVYVLDNQTVTLDSNGGARGKAGFATRVTATGKCMVWFGPHVVGMIAVGAVVAADLDTAETAIDALEVDAATSNAEVQIPIASFVDADGDPLAKFVSAADTTFGFNLADSKAYNLRWNNHATPGTALCSVNIPADLDPTAAAELEFDVSKSGATLGDATVLTIAAYVISDDALHDADTNCGGDTAAVTGDATAKTVTKLSRTIAAADIPDTKARSITFTVTPKAGTLGTDDLMLHSARLRYTRKVQTA